MMAVLHDYVCKAHGRFEGFEQKCPHGCGDGMVEMIFLKPPGMISDRSKNIDRTLSGLASDFGLTDMNNQNGTSASIRPDWKAVKEREEIEAWMGKQSGQDTSEMWGQMTPGGTYEVGKGAVSVEGRAGGGAQAAIQSMHALPGNALSDVISTLPAPKANVVARDNSTINTAGAAE